MPDIFDEISIDPNKGGWDTSSSSPSTFASRNPNITKYLNYFGNKAKSLVDTLAMGGISKADEASKRWDNAKSFDDKAGAISDAIGATGRASTVLLGGPIVKAYQAGKLLPLAGEVATGLGLGTAADWTGHKVAEELGAGPGVSELTGTVAGTVPVAGVGKRIFGKYFSREVGTPKKAPGVQSVEVDPTVTVTGGVETPQLEAPPLKVPARLNAEKGKPGSQMRMFDRKEMAGKGGGEKPDLSQTRKVRLLEAEALAKEEGITIDEAIGRMATGEAEAPVVDNVPIPEPQTTKPVQQSLPGDPNARQFDKSLDALQKYYEKLRAFSASPGFKDLMASQQSEVRDSLRIMKNKLRVRNDKVRLKAKKETLQPGDGSKLFPRSEGTPYSPNPEEDMFLSSQADEAAIEEAKTSNLGWLEKFGKNYIDSLWKWEQLVNKVKGGELAPEKNISDQYDRSLRADQIGEGWFMSKMGKVIQSLKTPEDNLIAGKYIQAKRLVDLYEKGVIPEGKFPASFDIQGKPGSGYLRAKKWLADPEMQKRYEPIAQEATKFANETLKKLFDEGIITKEIYEDSMAQHGDVYAILHRVFNNEGVLDTRFTSAPGSLERQSVVKELGGDANEVAFENPLALLFNRAKAVARHIEINNTAKLAAEYGGIIPSTSIPPEISGSLKGYMQLASKPGPQLKDNQFAFLFKGKRVVVDTLPELAGPLRLLEKGQGDAFLSQLSKFIRVSKAGITGLNPVFALGTNVLVDQPTAISNMEGGLKGVVEHFKAMPKALAEVWNRGDLYHELQSRGALGSSYDILRGGGSDAIERLWADKSLSRKAYWLYESFSNPGPNGRMKEVKKILGEIGRHLENRFAMLEEMTRMQQWMAANKLNLDKGLDPQTAALLGDRAARWNTANFLRTGDAGRAANAIFLYANAQKEGTRAWLKSFKRNPGEFAIKAFTLVGIPVAWTTYNNLSSDRNRYVYNDIPEEVKANNLIFIMPGAEKGKDGRWDGVYTIPMLRHGPGQAASAVRHMLEEWYKVNEVDFLQYGKDVFSSILPETSMFNLHATRPIMEVKGNVDLFTGRSIVPRGEEKKPLVEQRNKKVGNLEVDLGKVVNKVHVPLSPPQIRHLEEGYLGRFAPTLAGGVYDNTVGRLTNRKQLQPGDGQLGEFFTKPFSRPYGGAREREYQKKIKERQNFKDSFF